MNGWIRLHRQLIENGWMQDHPVFILMIYCLLKAAYEPTEIPFRGDRIGVKKGQLIFGRLRAVEETGLTSQNIRTALKKLEKYEFLTIRSTNRYSLITICNWETYQTREDNDQPTDQPASNQQVTSNQPASQPQTISKEVKERKKKEDKLFNEFWQKYPRREGKRQAQKAFMVAIKRIGCHKPILAGLLTSERLKREPKYIPHATTWLNGDGWDDEPTGFASRNKKDPTDYSH